MTTSFLSTQSRKAWVAGVVAALVQPVLTLLSGTDVLTIRTLVVAILSGVIAAVAVWVTDNADSAVASTTPPGAGATTPATGTQTADEGGTDFAGQTVPGE